MPSIDLPSGIRIGTSGWSYDGWKTGFYASVPRKNWLRYCADHFAGIEVNMTFYRQPRATTIERWFSETPDSFAFAVKGHRLITHSHKTDVIAGALERQRTALLGLGDKLSAVLWQLPRTVERNLERLTSFAAALADWPEVCHVMEFRHRSWFDGEVERLLKEFKLANCISDAGRWPRWDTVTSDVAYVRLHGVPRTYASKYQDPALIDWANKVASWHRAGLTVHVYFDNDAKGYAPYNALRLMEIVSERVIDPAANEARTGRDA